MKPMTPLRAIRAKCLWCSNDQPREVTLCPVRECPLWTLRAGRNAPAGVSRIKAIRRKCLDCAENPTAVRTCKDTTCALWPYRLGRNPSRTRKTEPEPRPERAEFAPKPPVSRRISQHILTEQGNW